MPKDPRAVFAAAAPFYDFASPELKPWHLKATYQLYDDAGKPSEQGTFEYWWASPQIHRSTWTRAGATYTDWRTADGNYSYLKTGERLGFFENELYSDFLAPLPHSYTLDPTKALLELKTVSSGKVKVPCVMVTPSMLGHELVKDRPLGSSPTYCFDPQVPVLRFTYNFNSVTTEFDNIVKIQNRYLGREILVSYGKRKLLSAHVDSITELAPSDPALTPSPDATIAKHPKVLVNGVVTSGMAIRKQAPIYPDEARSNHISGTVLLMATIGRDGTIHDLSVVLSPSALLSQSAMQAVSHWVYKPYLLNGEPVEVDTTINVIYALGG
ncbi:MAG: energy transducer TonB [Terracidiphilus sp.]